MCTIPHKTPRALRFGGWGPTRRMVSNLVTNSPREGVELSFPRSPRAAGGGAGAFRLRKLALASGLAALAVSAPAAHADLTAVGPVDPSTQVPAWFQDANGQKLGLCLTGPFCVTPITFGQPDGEGFYFNAGADLTINGGGSAKLVLAQEAVSPPTGPAAFMRARVILKGAVANANYVVHHPFGNVAIHTDATGGGKATADSGCTLGPCPSFAGALTGQIGPFLAWTPDPAQPANHIGDGATPHTVTGGTNGNVFSVVGPGGASTNLFTVAGQTAGPPVAVYHGPGSIDFGSMANGTASAPQTATVTSYGVPDGGTGASNLTVSNATISGPAAADYKVLGSTCGGSMPSGTACDVTVQFTPTAGGPRSASLDVAANAASGVNHIALSGAGIAPAPVPVATASAVAGASARSQLSISKVRTTHRMTRARVSHRGLRFTMRLPQGTEILKVSVLRIRKNRAPELVWFAYRHPSKAGLYRLNLGSRKLRKRLKAGLYVVNVTPGVSKTQLGQTSTTRIRITRR